VVMEAMKMEHVLKAPKKGKCAVSVSEGDLVGDSQELIRIA